MILFTAEDCPKCEQIKSALADLGTVAQIRPATDLQGCDDWKPLVGILAELTLQDWDGELPVAVAGEKVLDYSRLCEDTGVQPLHDCEGDSCKL